MGRHWRQSTGWQPRSDTPLFNRCNEFIIDAKRCKVYIFLTKNAFYGICFSTFFDTNCADTIEKMQNLKFLHFYPTVLTVALLVQFCVCLSVCRLSVTLCHLMCIVAKRCVLEQKLLLRAYRKLYMRNRLVPWYQNEWPWPLFRGRIKVTSTIALHLKLNISETVRDRGLVPKDYQ